MTTYYVTILIFIFIGVTYKNLPFKNDFKIFLYFLFCILFTFYFGLRTEVGVDWFNYIRVFNDHATDAYFLDTIEIGYKSLNVTVNYFGGDITYVVFITTFLFIFFTLLAAIKVGVNPFLFFAIIAPYHFVMSGMNYTRQAVALSIALYAFACLITHQKSRFIVFTVIATFFHSSAIAFLPLAFLNSKKRYILLASALSLPILLFGVMRDYSMYLNSQIESSGVYLRVVFLIVPMFITYNSLKLINLYESNYIKRIGFLTMFYFPICCFVILLSSTLADRISYYFIIFSTLFVCKIKNDFSSYASSKWVLRYSEVTLFLTSIMAFIIWTLFSSFIKAYEFKNLILEQL